MAILLEKHALLAQHLLPPGHAYPREMDTILFKVLQGLFDEMDRVDFGSTDAFEQIYPDVQGVFLTDWERIANSIEKGPWNVAWLPMLSGIAVAGDRVQEYEDYPGRDVPLPLDPWERVRFLLLTRLTLYGGSSVNYWEWFCHALGYDSVKITEFIPCWAGWARAGDRCYDTMWSSVWVLQLSGIHYIDARAGQAHAGDNLIIWETPLVIDYIQKYKPAHTFLRWGPSDGYLGDGSDFLTDENGNYLIA
jgi:uncharacterized protein YmfQ (DUF2313 family)